MEYLQCEFGFVAGYIGREYVLNINFLDNTIFTSKNNNEIHRKLFLLKSGKAGKSNQYVVYKHVLLVRSSNFLV
jgi:hypothetical protein